MLCGKADREPLYPVVFCDALRGKIRDEATVRIKAVYHALAVLSVQ
jgi:transposase-like protein